MHHDSISDYLTRIRNAMRVSHATVSIPYTRILEQLTQLLQSEGYLARYEVSGDTPSTKKIKIYLKYDAKGYSVIHRIERVSKPGLRKYAGSNRLPRVLSGAGILVLTTNQGLMTDRKARQLNVGGEVLCMIY
jgi:small subunit ribosomal protein S8